MARSHYWKIAAPVAALVLMLAASALYAEPSLQLDTRLPEAVRSGDVVTVKALLREHVPVNSAEGDGSTALHWAAYDNNLDIARLLIAAHADVNATTRLEAQTPLYMAAENGSAPMVELLLRRGAHVNQPDSLGTTPLMVASAAGNVEAVKALLDHGAIVNTAEYQRNQTALMFAAAYNRAAVISLLLAHGGDPNLESKVVVPYHLPFHSLENNGKYGKKNAAEAKTEASDEANSATVEDVLKEIKSSTVATAQQPETAEIGGGSAKPVVGAANAKGKKPVAAYYLHGAKLMGGMSPLLYAARQGNMEAVDALIAGGANINETSGSEHTTPLLLAIDNGHYDVARDLLEHGADPNIANDFGLTPLYDTVDVKWAPVEWSPMPLVSQQKTSELELLKLLIAHGANLNARIDAAVWQHVLSENQVWIDVAGSTAFFRAAQADDLPAMRLLKEAGADTNIPTYAGDTPLMAAAGLGWGANFSVTMPGRLDAVKYCVALGNKVNQEDLLGYTALGGAAFAGDLDVIHYLVQQGADIHAVDKAGDTVADLANGLFEKSIPQPKAVALLVSMGVPEPHNCRSSECLVNTNANIHAANAAAAKIAAKLPH